MSEPRLCIVGAGSLATQRIYPYIGVAGAVLAGVCDIDRPKAEEKSRRFGGAVYTDMLEMLDAEKPDGVIICIGPEAHAVMAIEALRRGIPVYTEKPPASSALDAYEVVKVSRETGVQCMTGFKKRYATAYRRAGEWLAGYDPAERLSISIDYASAHYTNHDNRNSFLLDFGIHAIDLVGCLFGDVDRVFAFQKDGHAYSISVAFLCGAVGSLNLTDGRSFALPTEEVEITMRGGNFMTIHNSSVWRIAEEQKAVEWREPPTFVSGGDSGKDTGHLTELASFVASLGSAQPRPSDIYESYKSMVLYEAIKNSAATGKVVEVHYEN